MITQLVKETRCSQNTREGFAGVGLYNNTCHMRYCLVLQPSMTPWLWSRYRNDLASQTNNDIVSRTPTRSSFTAPSSVESAVRRRTDFGLTRPHPHWRRIHTKMALWPRHGWCRAWSSLGRRPARPAMRALPSEKVDGVKCWCCVLAASAANRSLCSVA